MSKKSELYQWAMIAVVQAEHLTPMTKIEVIDRLLTDQRLALFSEGELKVSADEEEEKA